ncbi:hypothetical protein B0H34DRAFT_716419 [Crassisporium funariophilum]|nr:hypothetical protein B0H34DRAFT_716419 [Crassisporium funariophilum]
MLYSTWLSHFIITIFNLGVNVSGRAQFGKRGLAGRQDVAHVDPATLTTNAARMAAGLAPLKPRNMFGLATTTANAMSITFTPTIGANAAPFNVAVDYPGTYPYLGFAGDDLTNQPNNTPLLMARTNPTSPGSGPSTVGNSHQTFQPKSASAIWSFNSSNKRLTPQWKNPNGGSPTTYIWYYPLTNTLGIINSPSSQPAGSYQVYIRAV